MYLFWTLTLLVKKTKPQFVKMLVENTVKSRLLKKVVQILMILFSLNNNFVSYYSSHSYS